MLFGWMKKPSVPKQLKNVIEQIRSFLNWIWHTENKEVSQYTKGIQHTSALTWIKMSSQTYPSSKSSYTLLFALI